MSEPFKRLANAVLLLAVATLGGCVSFATYPNLEPVAPKPNGMALRDPVKVDSLRPTFQWKASGGEDRTDLVIWQAIKSVDAPLAKYDTRGSVVYEKDNIAGTEFQVDKELTADTVYFWSIRPSGTQTWSTATQHVYGLASGHEPMVFFLIKTPTKIAGASDLRRLP